MTSNKNINNHNNKNSQINKNNIPGRPAKSNVAAHNEHSVDTRELALEMLIEINERDRKSTRLNSSHIEESRMPSSA